MITGPGTGHVERVPDPTPAPDEVVVAPAVVGICGTDAHIFAGRFRTTYPLVNDHEFSGTVVAIGRDVARWKNGDRVVVDPTLYCGACYRCLRRQANHCERWGALGDTADGAMAELVKAPARNLYRLEDHETFGDAVFTEPLACVVWGIERLRVRPGDRALVLGSGPVGCLMAAMLAMSEVTDVVVVDMAEEKLAVARALGATATLHAGPSLTDELRRRSGNRGFDIVVDCTGQPQIMEGLPSYAAPGARIMFFGVAPPDATIRVSPYDVYRNDWEIVGSMAINYTFQQARDLITSGRIKVQPLVTRIAGLDDVAEILSPPKPSHELKVLIRPGAGAGAEGAA